MFKTLMIALAGLGFSTLASATSLVEGQHYDRLPQSIDTSVAEDQIEILEVFWYGCPHCNNLQQPLNAWLDTLSDDVIVVHMPATMGGDWNTHATAYYAADQLGIADQTHADFFAAIHQDGRNLNTIDEIAAFYSGYDVTEEEARQALNSFGVKNLVNQAHNKMRTMQLRGVPALVVDGRYLITSTSAGSLENMPQIADALIEMVREERAD